MPLDVMLVVLLSALLHAGWNALVRSSGDKLLSTLLIVWGAGALSLPFLLWLPLPAAASWPYLLASVLIHGVYFTLVAWSYQHADLSLAYPLMRGTAPALTAVAALIVLQETLTPGGWMGVALICSGVLLLAWGVWQGGMVRLHTLRFALGNALVIAAYTLVDGQGARLSSHAFSYTGWLFFLTALLMLGVALFTQGRALLHRARTAWRTGLLGGTGTLTAYGLVLWAMAHAPIALVAALRETSIAFAVLLGALLLKERIRPLRYAAIALMCTGAAAIKLL